MLSIFKDLLTSATTGSKPRHQRLSHEEWQDRFLPRHRKGIGTATTRFDRNRDLW